MGVLGLSRKLQWTALVPTCLVRAVLGPPGQCSGRPSGAAGGAKDPLGLPTGALKVTNVCPRIEKDKGLMQKVYMCASV